MERRRSRRHILCIDLTIDAGDDDQLFTGKLLDISSTGMYVVIDAVIGTKRLGRLSFSTDADERRCHAFGRVVRYVFGEHDTGVGLSFTEHDGGFEQWLATFDDVTETGRARVAQLLKDVLLRLR
ncbi:MAG TPA: PilZ domain-containing protein [Nannocystaceae bacterium]|nr:PilZ domain-containing protein [Nannocystaceae bacterium]